jgi:hypothetical protein
MVTPAYPRGPLDTVRFAEPLYRARGPTPERSPHPQIRRARLMASAFHWSLDVSALAIKRENTATTGGWSPRPIRAPPKPEQSDQAREANRGRVPTLRALPHPGTALRQQA